MPRRARLVPCVACPERGPRAAGTKRLRVEGRTVTLCARHAAPLDGASPATWDELRRALRPAGERRSPLPRRADAADDRRVFPPRPEGRRRGVGRRAPDAGA